MSDTPIDREFARLLGRLLKEHRQNLSEIAHEADVWRGELAFIDVLVTSPDGTGTTDDTVTDLAASYADGGHWRSSIVRRLTSRRLIVRIETVASCRVSRRAGYVGRYRVIDCEGLIARRAVVEAVVRALGDIASGSTGRGTADTPLSAGGGESA